MRMMVVRVLLMVMMMLFILVIYSESLAHRHRDHFPRHVKQGGAAAAPTRGGGGKYEAFVVVDGTEVVLGFGFVLGDSGAGVAVSGPGPKRRFR